LTQQYQTLSGTLAQTSLSAARMDGTAISFSVAGVRYVGTVDNDTMIGRTDSGAAWSAARL